MYMYMYTSCTLYIMYLILTEYEVKKKIHGSRETRLEAGLSASVGTPPPFKDQGAATAPKAVGGE